MQKNIKMREPGPGLQRLGRINASKTSSSVLTENIRQEILFVKVERIIPFRAQARAFFPDEEIETLARTIKEHGIRQPLTIIPSKDQPNFYEVVSGERRLRAAKMVGLEKVPAILIHDEEKAEEIALIENVQRKDLHPIELGRAYRRLFESGMYRSQGELAEKIGLQRTQISEYIQFSNLPDEIIEKVLERNLFRRSFLRALVSTNNAEERLSILQSEIDEQEREKNGKSAATETLPSKEKKIAPPLKKNLKLIQLNLREGALKVDDRGLKQCPPEVLTHLKGVFAELISKIENIENSLN